MRLLVVILCLFASVAYGAAPIVGVEKAKAASDTYIVVLEKSISEAGLASHLEKTKKYTTSSTFHVGNFRAYTVQASNDSIAEIAQSPEVSFIELDQIISLPATARHKSRRDVQANAPWGLARISHRAKGSTDYVFSPAPNTYVYVLDTGVRTTHVLFQGRATFGFNAVSGSSNTDGNGHGTHVAGIAASQTYGVTRPGSIVAVKILDDTGSTTTSAVISGINWTVQDIKTRNRVGRATALLAVGGTKSAALNNAVAAGSNAGVMFSVPAGNENTDAGNYSPASEPTACTAGGTTAADAVLSGSNYGTVVDIYAPGSLIPSLWYTSDTATATLSGGSMAAAHIAGLGAYFLSLEGPRGAVALCERLREVATKNVLTGVPSGTPNLLAYNLSGH